MSTGQNWMPLSLFEMVKPIFSDPPGLHIFGFHTSHPHLGELLSALRAIFWYFARFLPFRISLLFCLIGSAAELEQRVCTVENMNGMIFGRDLINLHNNQLS